MMDYAEQILVAHSRANTDLIAKAIGDNPKEFKKIIDLIYSAKHPIPQRASWLLKIKSRSHPELIQPYVTKLIDTVNDFKISGIRRHFVDALSTQKIPEKWQGKTVNICFDFILSPDEPVAVKVLSLEILSNIAKQYPELKNEIIAAIEDQLPKTTVAFHSRAKKVIKKLG